MFKSAFATALVSAFAVADNIHDDAKIAGLVEGFFVGAFDFHGMTDVAHCVSDANPVEEHFENAMRGFWNGSYQEATKAIDQLGLAVSDIGDMLDHCGKIDHHDYEQIQRMAEAFLHPKQILLEATESLIINGVNVFEDTREGLHDYRMGKWLDAGEHFGQAAAMLLYGKTQMVDHEELFYDFDNHWQELLDQIDHEKDEKMHHFEAMKSSNVHFTFFRMGKILEGLLAGSVEAEVPHGVECLRDAKHIWERFGGVIDQLKHGSFNSMLHAIEDMGHVIHDVANELEECKATVGTDLDKLREMSKAFTDPWYFIFHVEHDLIVNGQDIHHEIMDAEAQWENQHFYEFGHSVGLSLSKIFLGGQMKNDIPMHNLPTAQNGDDNIVWEHRRSHYAPHQYDHTYQHDTHYHEPYYYNESENKKEEANVAEDTIVVHEPVHHETVLHEAVVVPVHHETVHHEAVVVHEPVHHEYRHGEYLPSHHEGYYTRHGEQPVHHGYGYGDHHEYTHDEYHHESPHHYVERLTAHHEELHDEPRVVHDHPVHIEAPHHEYAHHEEYHQEEPHVEIEHHEQSGPTHHEYTTVIPRHEHEEHRVEHIIEEPVHHYETAHHTTHLGYGYEGHHSDYRHEPEYFTTEHVGSHYYQ